MPKEFKHIETKAVHAGEPDPRIQGAVAMPIFQSAMFEYAGETSYHDLKYIRLNNTPNHQALHAKLAALENAEAALVTASGMAAISTALLTVLGAGDHFLAQDCLYGGTRDLITTDFPALNISCDFIEGSAPDSWEKKLKPNTRAIYVESMTNPLLQVADLKAVVAFAKAHGLVTLIDNTFATPVNFRPIEWGFDLVLHSCTKYLNGHSDLVAGAVLGKREMIERITHKLNHLGGSLDPHACFLLHRGVKTLAVRMKQHNENALALAQFLEQHPGVEKVNYPGLASHPAHALARELFEGFSGMLSFELRGGLEATERFMQRVNLAIKAPSLGGVESLVTRPAITSHAGMPREDRLALGITDSLVRVSVGIEAKEELLEDFARALEA
ncbi:MAG: aminotransferase class I/II-fold pyridoxal phosphate-dependent enzyme [Calditrichaeota bacterium]|nr:MAG: aminotransferase class I/II-fold pyridoxal phosphate-dependent enzyme [Calditrichota bacterium]